MKQLMLAVVAVPLIGGLVAESGEPWTTKVKAGDEETVKVNFGGRVQWDYNFADEEIWADEAGTEFRRLRMFASGTIFDNTDFKVQLDFAGLGKSSAKSEEIVLADGTTKSVLVKDGKNVEVKDAYVGLSGLPIGKVIVGNKDIGLTLDDTTSSKYTAFVERSLPATLGIDPGREAGVHVHSELADGLVAYKLAAYKGGANGYSTGTDGWGYGGSLGLLPVSTDELTLMVGAAAYMQDVAEVEYAAHPELHMVPDLVVAAMPAKDATIYAASLGMSAGPVHMAAEYVASDVSGDGVEDSTASGYYAQAGLFLTGESRSLTASEWKRVKPKANFGVNKGPGAIELKARFSSVDLNDGALAGGEQENVTMGVNWFLNPHTAVKFDYVMVDVTALAPGVDGTPTADVDGSGGVIRFQIDF